MDISIAVWPAAAGTLVSLAAAVIATRRYSRLGSETQALEEAVTSYTDETQLPSFDVFIAYAGQDRDFVRMLARALVEEDLTVWSDEQQLQLGDRLTFRVAEGLARSRYSVVVLSPAFLERPWPQRELSALASRERSTGKANIIPVWHNVTAQQVYERAPVLADRLGASDERETITEIARRIAAAVR
jgi:hypothetical protein